MDPLSKVQRSRKASGSQKSQRSQSDQRPERHKCPKQIDLGDAGTALPGQITQVSSTAVAHNSFNSCCAYNMSDNKTPPFNQILTHNRHITQIHFAGKGIFFIFQSLKKFIQKELIIKLKSIRSIKNCAVDLDQITLKQWSML